MSRLSRQGRAIITLNGRRVSSEKLRRHVKITVRNQSQTLCLQHRCLTNARVGSSMLTFATTIFLKWNMPYVATRQLSARPMDRGYTLSLTTSTPCGDIDIVTPPSMDSPQEESIPSPSTEMLQLKRSFDHARLFIEGRHDDLLTVLDENEKRTMSDWLYQLWLFGFESAKHWGVGPRAWTVEFLDFDQHNCIPGSLSQTPILSISDKINRSTNEVLPSSLCRWFMHVSPDWEPYEESLQERRTRDQTEQDLSDESTWLPWPTTPLNLSLSTCLRNALEHNDFSSINATDLPLAIVQVAKAAESSPDELLVESLGFSIMSRNLSRVENALSELSQRGADYRSVRPLHLATGYLDGHKSCCDILMTLLKHVGGAHLRTAYTNEFGHTLLENLMISILKSHSSAIPSVVDSALKDYLRFTGEEVDICGRWDADSPCIRRLFANGQPAIPFSWKHKFCHTSAQTICHSISKISHFSSLDLFRNTASGLDVHQCFGCGMKLVLQPLHSLVMTAYHLADKGCQGEDLCGMLACLLCLITCGLDPRKSTNISVHMLLGIDVMFAGCSHEQLTPAGLATTISTSPTVGSWPPEARKGWAVFCGVLRRCEEADIDMAGFLALDNYSQHFIGPNDDGDVRGIHHEIHDCATPFGTNHDLATLWASARTELLTYRRLRDGDAWASPCFPMEQLYWQLQLGAQLSVEFTDSGLLQQHCICGMFGGYPLTTVAKAVDPELANLDVWERAKYGVLMTDE
ncbi:hypothetical protein NX059_008141 [Plenodomus lindquistii]|nr:hypothetical protein NX059_008141 [Plenodomus lindquistii]